MTYSKLNVIIILKERVCIMKLFEDKYSVTDIAVAVFVPRGRGTPVHKMRAFHGLALSVGQTVLYRFDTGEDIYCADGECIYLPKGSNYVCSQADSGEGGGTYAINFLTDRDKETFEPEKTRVSLGVRTLFEKAEGDFQRRGDAYREDCLSDLYRIISLLKKEKAVYRSKTEILKRIEPAIKYIDENYTKQNISVPYLASLCNMSEPYLRRMFAHLFSLSPTVYIRNKRIAFAKKLLVSGECSVTDAAFLSGFNDTAYFSREFKKALGISPADYIKG